MRLSDVVDFEAVQVPEIPADEKDLSSDQKYLLGIFNALRKRFVFPHLVLQKPGPLNHSRWLITACRIRFYLPTISCTDRFRTIHHERLCSCLVPDKK